MSFFFNHYVLPLDLSPSADFFSFFFSTSHCLFPLLYFSAGGKCNKCMCNSKVQCMPVDCGTNYPGSGSSKGG